MLNTQLKYEGSDNCPKQTISNIIIIVVTIKQSHFHYFDQVINCVLLTSKHNQAQTFNNENFSFFSPLKIHRTMHIIVSLNLLAS